MPLSPTDRGAAVLAQKREERRRLRALRRAFTAEQRAVWDRALCNGIVALPCFRKAKTVLAYYPIADEPNLLEAVRVAFETGLTVAFPVCEPVTATMVFRTVRSTDELISGAYGIPEPPDTCPELTDFSGALCLVPALSFDRRGFRIGYGKGYYDRFLAEHPVTTVGATYSALITDSLPSEPTDRAVTTVLTERGIFLSHEK